MAGQPPQAADPAALFVFCLSTLAQTAAELKPLQGYWEGEGAGGKCSIAITGILPSISFPSNRVPAGKAPGL